MGTEDPLEKAQIVHSGDLLGRTVREVKHFGKHFGK
jgi:hypothetical protein